MTPIPKPQSCSRAREIISEVTEDFFGFHGFYAGAWLQPAEQHRNGAEWGPLGPMQALAINITNFVGWIPGPGNVVGACRIAVWTMLIFESDQSSDVKSKVKGDPNLKWIVTAQIVRGVAEVLCLGFLFAPLDIGLTLGREYKDFRAAQHPTENEYIRLPQPTIMKALSGI